MSERLLLLDDDERFRERLGAALTRRGFVVVLAADGEEALRLADADPPDRAVLDLRMPGLGGLEVLQRLLDAHPTCEAVILTGYGSIATAVDAMRLGAVGYVQKPTDADAVVAAFERAAQPPLEPPDPDYEPPSLARVEWDHIQRVLSDCGGNITHAARKLGVHRRTLQRKLQMFPPKD
jgi:two-component system response regulator RegA